jgi:ankyrin repeat protein
MPRPPRSFTPANTIDLLKKEAKRWLKALRAGDPNARSRLMHAVPAAQASPTLRDVQHALAREYGFAGWLALTQAVSTAAPEPGAHASLVNRFLDNACPDHHVRGAQDHARARHTATRLLEQHPEIATDSFHTAVVCGDIAGVRRMLAVDPALATTRSPGVNIQRAMVGGSGDLFQDWGPKGWEPLLFLCFTRLPLVAVAENAVGIARALLEHGANPNAYFMAGDSRYTPLVGAIGGGEEDRPAHPRRDELVAVLLDAGAEPYDDQVIYNLGFSADYLWFLKLIHARSTAIGRAGDWDDPLWSMLRMGPYGSGAHWTLRHAIENGDAALVEWCLRHGASPNAPPPERADPSRPSPHQAALRLGQPEIADLLVRYGASPDKASGELSPEASLVAACIRGDVDSARRLLAGHPALAHSADGFFAAVESDRAEIVEMLLDLGASPNVPRNGQERPLHTAAANDARRVARLLVARGAEIDAREEHYSNTALGWAHHFHHHAMIDLLAEHSRDVWELTYTGKLERLRQVLAEDPRRARVSWEGQTPLMWLPPGDEQLALEIVQELVRHGADTRMANKEGMTAADRAEAIGMMRVAAYLRL